MASLIAGINFIPENISLDPSVHAAGDANKMVVEEGISFRDAYRRIGEAYKKWDQKYASSYVVSN